MTLRTFYCIDLDLHSEVDFPSVFATVNARSARHAAEVYAELGINHLDEDGVARIGVAASLDVVRLTVYEVGLEIIFNYTAKELGQ